MSKNKYRLIQEEYAKVARASVAEGVVLLENKRKTLPIKNEEKVSVFGRIQFDYYKSGTGSGGLVNTEYVDGILDALRNEDVKLNEKLIKVYKEWLKENPFDKGAGWGLEPWSQKEMLLEEEVVKMASEESDIAIVIIGRTAGEDQDNVNEKGSYLLTDLEEEMISKVCKAFEKVAVILNVGNIIDMSWVVKYNPSAVLYAWQGGIEGGNGLVDVLLGHVNPSGKLSDSIAYSIDDYPSTSHFGGDYSDIYTEDIYVGYRYFETFARDRVQYPFGFGLSYTEFDITWEQFERRKDQTIIGVRVKNIGDVAGKEVVQVYINPPQGKLGKPVRNLVGYEKTDTLKPGESQEIVLVIEDYLLSSYDDKGITNYQFWYVMEEGSYEFYVGNNVRSAKIAGTFTLSKTQPIKQCTSALAPVEIFNRIKPNLKKDDYFTVSWEEVPQRTNSMKSRIDADTIEQIVYTGNKGIKLIDVLDNKNTLEEFVAQLTDKELSCLVRGEGMCSSKVTPGTAAAFGGLSKSLIDYGIPAGCCADGPSGIRMDCGTKAFSLPNGTLLACTFNQKLIESLFIQTGLELRKNRIDTLLGPGMNIHRNPLNGRNFEYFSEDPYLTGTMAAAQLKGMHHYRVTGTMKHFAANNQEHNRRLFNAVVSERALREIYLKGFEIAVKNGKAYSIMTTYGAINGIYTASNYDLLTVILRKEWNYDGMVMTDWWADMNDEGGKPSTTNTAAMVRGQNDIFMVIENAEQNSNHDNLEESLENGTLRRSVLQRSAMNICRVLLRLPCMERMTGRLSQEELEAIQEQEGEANIDFNIQYQEVNDYIAMDISEIDTQKGAYVMYGLSFSCYGIFEFNMKIKANTNVKELAQIPVSIFINGTLFETITINGTDTNWIEVRREIGPFFTTNNYIKLYFAQSGMVVDHITISLKQEIEKKFIHSTD